ELYTAPEGGFASADDYYARCSAGPRLAEITTRGVILTSADDPFVDPAVHRDFCLPPELLLHVEPHGGHVGYLERHGWRARSWLAGALVHSLEAPADPARAASPPR